MGGWSGMRVSNSVLVLPSLPLPSQPPQPPGEAGGAGSSVRRTPSSLPHDDRHGTALECLEGVFVRGIVSGITYHPSAECSRLAGPEPAEHGASLVDPGEADVDDSATGVGVQSPAQQHLRGLLPDFLSELGRPPPVDGDRIGLGLYPDVGPVAKPIVQKSGGAAEPTGIAMQPAAPVCAFKKVRSMIPDDGVHRGTKHTHDSIHIAPRD